MNFITLISHALFLQYEYICYRTQGLAEYKTFFNGVDVSFGVLGIIYSVARMIDT